MSVGVSTDTLAGAKSEWPDRRTALGENDFNFEFSTLHKIIREQGQNEDTSGSTAVAVYGQAQPDTRGRHTRRKSIAYFLGWSRKWNTDLKKELKKGVIRV